MYMINDILIFSLSFAMRSQAAESVKFPLQICVHTGGLIVNGKYF